MVPTCLVIKIPWDGRSARPRRPVIDRHRSSSAALLRSDDRWNGLEHLHTVVRRIRRIDPSGPLIDDDAVEVAKFTVSGAFLAPHGDEHPLLVKHLHAIVADLSDVDIVMLIDG